MYGNYNGTVADKIVRKIAIVLPNGETLSKSEANSPFSDLIDILNNHDFNLVSVDEKHEYLICFNYQKKILRKTSAKKENRMLVVMEPSVTRPSNHNIQNRLKFAKTIVFSPKWILGDDLLLPWPQKRRTEYITSKGSRKLKACQIISNKYSFINGQNYGLRRNVIVSLGNKVDTFGVGWRDSIYRKFIKANLALLRSFPNLKIIALFEYLVSMKASRKTISSVNDKLKELSNYEIALVIENSMDYVSEKLVDAIMAGACPIYVGPKLSDFGFPAGIAIQCSASVREIECHVDELIQNRRKREQIRDRGFEFIRSEGYTSFENTTVFSLLAKMIIEEFSEK